MLTKKDCIRYGCIGVLLCGAAAYAFYRSMSFFLLLAPAAAVLTPLSVRRRLTEKRKRKLTDEFKDAMLSVGAFLGAGMSLENSFIRTYPELLRMYGEDSYMCRELKLIISRIRLNEPVERVLTEFAERSGVDDIKSFAEVFVIARKRGGSMKDIIEDTAGVIRDKAAVNEEIRNMTASKRYEQNIMNFLPFAVIAYIDMTSDGFMDIMYSCTAGRIIMTLCLALTCLSYLLSQKMLDIKV